MLYNKREIAIEHVYEAAVAALKKQRNRKEITDHEYLAGVKQLYDAFMRDLNAEHEREDAFYAEDTWENGRLAL